MRSQTRFLRSASLLGALALLPAAAELGACASLAETPAKPTDLAGLAQRLVEAARERVELNRVRVVVQDIRPLQATLAERPAANGERVDLVGVALEHGFVNALAGLLNVVESERVTPGVARAPASTLSDLASTYGATHLLVGDYQRRRGEVLVSVRLIEAESHLIVAAVTGLVCLPELVDEHENQRLADAAPEKASKPLVAASGTAVVYKSEVASAPATVLAETPSPSTAPRTSPASLPPPVSAPTHSSTTSGVQDFETWRANRVVQASTTQVPPPKPRPAPATPVPAPAATTAATSPEDFPWRRMTWLAHLLGIPPEPPSNAPAPANQQR